MNCLCNAQVWLLTLLVLVARASTSARALLTLGLAALTAVALPAKLWQPQLERLGKLGLIVFLLTAIGAGKLSFLSFLLAPCACTLSVIFLLCLVCSMHMQLKLTDNVNVQMACHQSCRPVACPHRWRGYQPARVDLATTDMCCSTSSSSP